MMESGIWNSNIWNVISSLSTFAAVIVSLYLANRVKARRILIINQQFRENFFLGEICLLVTIENVGDVPIILNNYGRKTNENNVIMKDIQEFLKGKDEFIMIRPQEAKLITYKYKFGHPFKEYDIKIHDSSQYKLLSKAIFIAEDTLGNFYQTYSQFIE